MGKVWNQFTTYYDGSQEEGRDWRKGWEMEKNSVEAIGEYECVDSSTHYKCGEESKHTWEGSFAPSR